jgi:hypothetical protein
MGYRGLPGDSGDGKKYFFLIQTIQNICFNCPIGLNLMNNKKISGMEACG